MKSYEKMAEDVFRRRDEYEAAKRAKQKAARRVVASGVCLTLFAAVCLYFVTVLHKPTVPSYEIPPDDPEEQKILIQEKIDAALWYDRSSENLMADIASSYSYWNGLLCYYTVYGKLVRAEAEGADTVFAIIVKEYPESKEDRQRFDYNGHSVDAWQEMLKQQEAELSGMKLLQSEGALLQYGEALYTTGTPSGELWSREKYELHISRYKKELLEKYLADGRFLSEELAADIQQQQEKCNALRQCLKDAEAAYHDAFTTALYQCFRSYEIPVCISKGNCFIFATANLLKKLDPEVFDNCLFSLAELREFE